MALIDSNNLGFFAQSIVKFLGSYWFFLPIQTVSLALKSLILVRLIKAYSYSRVVRRSLFFLMLALISAIFVESAWVIKGITYLFFPTFSYKALICFYRITWAWNTVQYQGFSLFISSLFGHNKHFTRTQKAQSTISAFILVAFVYFAIFHFHQVTFESRPYLEQLTMMVIPWITLFISISTLATTLSAMRHIEIPEILKRQVRVLIQWILFPIAIADIIQMAPFTFAQEWISNLTVMTLSTAFLTGALYYCARRVARLRFLNLQAHVQIERTFNFIDNFKDILEQLSHAQNVRELEHTTRTFFNAAFEIPYDCVHLYMRNADQLPQGTVEPLQTTTTHIIVENFLTYLTSQEENTVLSLTIKDELEFSNFYNSLNTTEQLVLKLLNDIDADIFIPIYKKQTMVAYIVVVTNARAYELYSNVERDEMLVFSNYLKNIIDLMQNRDLSSIMQREKELSEELYNKEREITQYKESIRTFLRESKNHRPIGVIFYRGKQFFFANKDAKEMVSVNLNTHTGDPVAQAIRTLVRHVQEYHVHQTHYVKDDNHNTLIISGVPSSDSNNVVITVHYPEISDVIKQQIDLLKDPSRWDYLLYLETTQSGQLVNQLVPGGKEELLNFKIKLLEAAMSPKAILLDVPPQDVLSTVEIIHHISLRSSLQVLNLQATPKNQDDTIKLFGINPLFAEKETTGLIEKLNKVGTLYIKNVHHLNIETQNTLAEFIKYGFYKKVKSERQVFANVRIICSSTKDLAALVQNGTFSPVLYKELSKSTLSMPALRTLSSSEIHNLTDGISQQALSSNKFKSILKLTDKEKDRLSEVPPLSLQELRNKVKGLLIDKSKKRNIYHETKFDPSYSVSDPQLIEAAKMGKSALKDRKMLELLWKKFKNQNQIAHFLGVNRSSVHRRCKAYSLE